MKLKIKDIQNYIEGTANHLADQIGLLPEEVKVIVADRQAECMSCSFLELGEGEVGKCTICSCKFPHLTYAKDKKCPKGYWKEFK